jgi:hypothetical protein
MYNDEARDVVIYSLKANIHVYLHEDLNEIYLYNVNACPFLVHLFCLSPSPHFPFTQLSFPLSHGLSLPLPTPAFTSHSFCFSLHYLSVTFSPIILRRVYPFLLTLPGPSILYLSSLFCPITPLPHCHPLKPCRSLFYSLTCLSPWTVSVQSLP